MNKAYIIKRLSELAEKNKLTVEKNTISRVIDFSQVKVFPKGTFLKNTDDKADTVGILLDGLVRCCFTDDGGNDITRGFAVPGSMCFDEGMIGYEAHISMWEALSESTVMICKVNELKKIIFSDDNLMQLWIALLESALRYKIYRETGFLTESAKERYIHFKKIYPALSNRVSQKHIASFLGITPESLSRIKRSLKNG